MMRRVMLVDDEVLVLRALQRTMRPLLQDAGVEIETFSDPEQALLRCAETGFDVVMSDYRMPGLNGAELLRVVMGLQPDAVRLVLSASTDFAEVSNAINRAEVFRYVAKPWEAEELKEIFLLAFQRHDEAVALRRRLAASEGRDGISAAEREAHRLEAEEPGITRVDRDDDGAIYLDLD
jgi:DNA-binding NtrC family response regulator